jgi:hypothetical protein
MAMNRRQFLRVSGTTAVAAGLTSGGRGASVDASFELHALAQPDLLSVLGPDVVREIGLRYRVMVPAENEMPALHAAVLAARPWPSRVPWLPGPRVVEMVEDDFASGRTIVVQGWVLSATEARQSALFSFLPS